MRGRRRARGRARRRPRARRWTFQRLADEWHYHAQDVRRAKPSSLRDLRSVLAKPGTPKCRGGGELAARLMRILADVPAAEVDAEDVDGYSRSLSKGGASARTVNRHRAVLLAIFNFGCSPSSKSSTSAAPPRLESSATRAFEPTAPGDPSAALLEALRNMPPEARAELFREAAS